VELRRQAATAANADRSTIRIARAIGDPNSPGTDLQERIGAQSSHEKKAVQLRYSLDGSRASGAAKTTAHVVGMPRRHQRLRCTTTQRWHT
jgi:hypothetical protein